MSCPAMQQSAKKVLTGEGRWHRITTVKAKSMSLNVTFDRRSLIINGKREFILGGAFHYYRLPAKETWKDRLQKMKDAGLNAVDIYFPWNYHSEKEGEYNFSGNRDVEYLLKLIEDSGLYLVARPGPYICSEIDGGGFPGWLLAKKELKLRCRENGNYVHDEKYVDYVRQWYGQIVPKITQCKTLILFQIENEYNYIPYGKGLIGFFSNIFRATNPRILPRIMMQPYFKKQAKKFLENLKAEQPEHTSSPYMKELYKMSRGLGVGVPIFHNDTVSFAPRQHDVDVMAIDDYAIMDFKDEWRGNESLYAVFDLIEKGHEAQGRNSPIFVAEMQGGWYDMWGGYGFDVHRERLGIEQLDIVTKNAVAQGASLISWYMFVGGTTYGYLGSPDVYTSYDFASPLAESGLKTERYETAKELCRIIRGLGEDVMLAKRDDTAGASDDGVLYRVRKSENKTYVFLRNLSRDTKRLKLDFYNEEITCWPVEERLLVFDAESKLLENIGQMRIAKPEKKQAPFALPELKEWTLSYASPQLTLDYDDASWTAIPLSLAENQPMDIDSLGLHYGYVWYRGNYTGKLDSITIDARHCYSIYVNGALVKSYDNFPNVLGVGKDFARAKTWKISPDIQTYEQNVIIIVVESLGHNKDFEEDAKNPRGVIKLSARGAPVSWKFRGGLVKGEKGLTPVVDFSAAEKGNAVKISLPYNIPSSQYGVFLLETEFSLQMPRESIHDFPVFLEIPEAHSKANLYLNGVLLGRYWQEWGPQKKFYLPPGILNTSGGNHLTLAVWKRAENGRIGSVRLTA